MDSMEKMLEGPKEDFAYRLDKPLLKHVQGGVLIERFEVAMKVDVYSQTRLGNIDAQTAVVIAMNNILDLQLNTHSELDGVYKLSRRAGPNTQVEAYMFRNPDPDTNELILRTKTFANSKSDPEGESLASLFLEKIARALTYEKSTQNEGRLVLLRA